MGLLSGGPSRGKAQAALKRGDFEVAVPLYDELTRHNPHDARAWVDLVRCRWDARGQLRRAPPSPFPLPLPEPGCRMGVRSGTDGGGTVLPLRSVQAKCKLGQKLYAQATDLMIKARQCQSKENEFGLFNHEYHYLLGDLYDRQGMCAKAVEHYETGLKMEHMPHTKGINYDNIYFRLGVNCKEVKEWEKAAKYLDKIENPTFIAMSKGDIMCEIEKCWAELGEYDKASRCMDTALETLPVRTHNLTRIAWHMYQRTQSTMAPLDLLRRVIEKDEDDHEAWRMLGLMWMDQHQYAKAEDALMQSCEINEDNVEIWEALGKCYSAMGKDDLAMQALQRATEIDKDGAGGAFAMMAKMYEAFGMAGNAMRMLEQLDPSDPQVMYRKNKILQKYAIKIQTVFRGWKARKQLMSRSVRVVARNYGCRAPLKNRSKDVVQRMGTYTETFTVSERGR